MHLKFFYNFHQIVASNNTADGCTGRRTRGWSPRTHCCEMFCREFCQFICRPKYRLVCFLFLFSRISTAYDKQLSTRFLFYFSIYSLTQHSPNGGQSDVSIFRLVLELSQLLRVACCSAFGFLRACCPFQSLYFEIIVCKIITHLFA